MNQFPEHLLSLPSEAAIGHLTEAVLQGRAPIPTRAIDRAARPHPAMELRTTAPIRELIDEAQRLHSLLHLTCAEAADGGLWNHLALRVASDYVFWRHAGRSSKLHPVSKVNRSRFVGPFHTQAFARLWWAAELFRDGYDYQPVVVACQNQDILNTALRMTVVLHRPTAQAILRLVADGTASGGREANALVKAVNAAGSTLSFETIAPDAEPDPDAYQSWALDRDDDLLFFEKLPEGPDDGRTPLASVNRLTELFRKLFADAPVRGRKVIKEIP